MNRNITISYVLAYLYHSWFWLGTWVFYYLRFTDYRGIGIIESIMIILTIFFDIPTGVITDRIGKKKSLFIAFLLCGIGNILFGFSTSFNTLIFSVTTFCLGSAFYSGTLEALQYDSLKVDGKELSFNKVVSKTNTYTLIAFAISSVLGGFLYNILPGLPFILVGLMHFIGVGLILFLIEPVIDTEKSVGLKTFFIDQIKGFKELTKSRRGAEISFVLGFVGIVVVVCSQALNDLLGYEFGFTPVYFGTISAVIYLFSAIASHNTIKLTDLLGNWRSVILLSRIISVTLILSPWLGIISGTMILTMRWISQSMFDVVSTTIINHQISSSLRATTLSTFNFIKNLPYAFTAVVLGGAMDGIGVKNFASYLGLFLLLFLTIYFLFIYKKSNLTKHSVE